jgi:acyl-CoA dehydrogenase
MTPPPDTALVADAVRQIVDSVASPEVLRSAQRAGMDNALWAALAEAGMTRVGIDSSAGGSGGSLEEAAAVVDTLARMACRVPAAEHLMVGCWALTVSGISMPEEQVPISVAAAETGAVRLFRGKLTGKALRVPWASGGALLVVPAVAEHGPVLCCVPAASASVVEGTNLAGEPRCDVTFDSVTVPADCVGEFGPDLLQEMRARYALSRAVQISAALDEVVAWTLQHAAQRTQFGRPLNRFQSVQGDIARMAGEAAAAAALAESAVERVSRQPGAAIACAAAKARAAVAASTVCRLSHQIHGAIGFTLEHRLHLLTTRLWSWRDEAGTEAEWSAYLAEKCLRNGGADLWGAISEVF